MKRLGLQVIYADETRMVLATRRFSLEDSRQSMRYVLPHRAFLSAPRGTSDW